MDIERAFDILKSPAMVNVSYRGIPVYIKDVNPQEQTAIVFPLDEMDHDQIVDLHGLAEKGPSI
jgi:small acid-soluble spore protein H (minor)